jgi:hypothetical protein
MSVQIPIFKYEWVKHPQGVEIDNYGFTIIDLTNVGHKDDLCDHPSFEAKTN